LAFSASVDQRKKLSVLPLLELIKLFIFASLRKTKSGGFFCRYSSGVVGCGVGVICEKLYLSSLKRLKKEEEIQNLNSFEIHKG